MGGIGGMCQFPLSKSAADSHGSAWLGHQQVSIGSQEHLRHSFLLFPDDYIAGGAPFRDFNTGEIHLDRVGRFDGQVEFYVGVGGETHDQVVSRCNII